MDAEQFRIVVFREGDLWVAQCLEYDIGAQAPDLGELDQRIALAIKLEREKSIELHGEPFAGIEPAPRHFHEMWGKQAGEFKPARPSQNEDDESSFDMALYA